MRGVAPSAPRLNRDRHGAALEARGEDAVDIEGDVRDRRCCRSRSGTGDSASRAPTEAGCVAPQCRSRAARQARGRPSESAIVLLSTDSGRLTLGSTTLLSQVSLDVFSLRHPHGVNGHDSPGRNVSSISSFGIRKALLHSNEISSSCCRSAAIGPSATGT